MSELLLAPAPAPAPVATAPRRATTRVQGASMVASTGLNSLLGLVFWLVAARSYDVEAVGLASAAVSALALLLGIGQLGLPLALPRLLPALLHRARTVVVWAYGAAVVASIVVALGFLALATVVDGLAPVVAGSAAYRAWFVVALPATVLFAVQDFVLCALGKAGWTPVENLAYSVLRLVALVAFVGLGAHGLFLAWTVPAALVVVPCTMAVLRFASAAERHAAAAGPSGRTDLAVRRVVGIVSSDWAGSLATATATRILPVIVLGLAGEAGAARFYVAWMVLYSLDAAVGALLAAATVDGARNRARLRLVVADLRPVLGLVVAAGAVAAVAGPTLLRAFGTEYAGAATTLRLLLAALGPRLVVVVATALARVDLDTRRVLLLQVVPAVLTLAAAGTLGRVAGVEGVAAGYLVAHAVVAAAAAPRLRQWWLAR